MAKLNDIYHARFHRAGNSWVITIPQDIREAMQLLPGDHIIMNYSHGILWAVRVTKDVLIPREKVAAIFDKLFPDKVPADV